MVKVLQFSQLLLLTSALTESISAAFLVHENTTTNFNLPLIVDQEPKTVRPYVLPHLYGYAVQAFTYVLRFPATNVSTAGALSFLTLHGQVSGRVPTHIHSRYHETFFVVKGAIDLYAQNETRRLGPLDIGSIPPYTNHSFTLVEPDTEVVGVITPGGFSFYQAVGETYNPADHAPFPADDPLPANVTKLKDATGLFYDYIPTTYPANLNLINGTTDPALPWHTGNNTLPGSKVPYYIAGGWGPKYLHRRLGQVIQLYISGKESDGALTVSTITMRAKLANETLNDHCSETAAQVLRVLEGMLHVEIYGQTAVLSTGDTVVVPAGVPFKYWSQVAFTRVYNAAAPVPAALSNGTSVGLGWELIQESEAWNYAVFPDYIG